VQALMSLFVLASKDGWVNIMYTGLDAVGVDQQVRQPHYVPRHYTDDALDARTPRSECDIEVLSLGQSQPVNQSINQVPQGSTVIFGDTHISL